MGEGVSAWLSCWDCWTALWVLIQAWEPNPCLGCSHLGPFPTCSLSLCSVKALPRLSMPGWASAHALWCKGVEAQSRKGLAQVTEPGRVEQA